jgi:hypothetical protein
MSAIRISRFGGVCQFKVRAVPAENSIRSSANNAYEGAATVLSTRARSIRDDSVTAKICDQTNTTGSSAAAQTTICTTQMVRTVQPILHRTPLRRSA